MRFTWMLALWAGLAAWLGAREIDDLAAKALAASGHFGELRTARQAAEMGTLAEMDGLAQVIRALSAEAPLSEAEVSAVRVEVKRLEALLRCKQLLIETNLVKAPADRRARAEELKAQVKNLAARQAEAVKPYDAKMQDFRASLAEASKRYGELLAAYFHKVDEGPFKGTTPGALDTDFADGFTRVDFDNGEEKVVAWAHLRLRAKPTIAASAKLLHNKHYVMSTSSKSVWLWAGVYEISFTVNRPDWQGEEKVLQLLQVVMDLDALGDVSPPAAGPVAPEPKLPGPGAQTSPDAKGGAPAVPAAKAPTATEDKGVPAATGRPGAG